ncbi:MAG: sulfatase-like hydrolase/transferase [Bryobacteraceae bacterium]|jgi:arylsulfatase A-like enzyme
MPLSRRHFFFGSLALPPLAAGKPAVERPNILLILADYLPSWILGCYGNNEVRTPNLDRFAQTGMRFLNHFACVPAPALGRATLLTGRTPMQLGEADASSPSEVPLSKVLEGPGYACAAGDSATAGKFLDQQAAGKPFFLTVGYASLRPPYDGVPRKYRDLYASVKFATFSQEAAARNAARDKEMLGDLSGNQRNAAAAVTALDDDVAALLSRLSQKQFLDHTLVIFTSTCGSLLGRHGLWDAGQASDPVNMYEEVIATPLLWSWPGHVPPQLTRPELVSAYDLVPTLCDLTGAGLPARSLCGRSYLPLATGKPLPKKQPWRTTVFGHLQNTEMAREKRYKLVLRDRGKGPDELYDLPVDPRERVNQYDNPQYLTVRTSLAAELSRWKQSYSA